LGAGDGIVVFSAFGIKAGFPLSAFRFPLFLIPNSAFFPISGDTLLHHLGVVMSDPVC
jgi:hypothetical protein